MTLDVLNAITETVEASFTSDWEDDRLEWGERVQLYRDYIDGQHRLEMTQAVADLLMIDKDDGERFTVNYSKLVMQKLADRLKVTGIKGSTDALTEWADKLRKKARFDGLQIDTHEDTISSGDNFVMIDSAPLADGQEFPAMVVEPAYNGNVGIVPIYDLTQMHMLAVVKIWEHDEQTTKKVNDGDDILITEYRVNVYYPDRIEKYVTNDGKLDEFPEDVEMPNGTIENTHVHAWVAPDGTPLGIPFVHFKHDSRSGKWNGESGIKSTISLNDVLNRATMSMTLIAELTAAMIRYIIGAKAPDGKVTPGMWVGIMEDGVPLDIQMPKVGTFEIGIVTPIVEESRYVIDQIANVTDTPLPGTMGSSVASGESLKQREIGFTARVEKLQTKFGNNWEDVIDIAYRVQAALGKSKPPAGADGWETIWKPAEVRNDVEVVENANKIVDHIDRRTYLETIAPVYGWDAERIDQILERQKEEEADSIAATFPRIEGNSFGGALNQTPLTSEALVAAVRGTGG